MNFKSGFVSIIGRPNVGKSTLVNALIGEKLSITSDKVQTTRNKIQCVLHMENSQIIFVDTPGIVRSVNTRLGSAMEKSASSALRGMDIILFVVTPDKIIGPMDKEIINALKGNVVFLLINKIDTISKNNLLEVIETYRKAFNFNEIIPVSAISGDTNNLPKVIEGYLSEGPMYFPKDMVTDQPERQIVSELIREKLLNYLQDEIPHGIAIEILKMKKRENSNIVDIYATIYCERESHKAIIIGKNGSLIKKVSTEARVEIEKLFGIKIFLQSRVKVKKDWRNNNRILQNLGLIAE